MKNKNLVWIGVVILLLIIGLFIFIGPKNHTPQTASQNSLSGQNTGTNNNNQQLRSLGELLAMNVPQQCSVLNKNTDSQSQVKIVMNQGKVRADINATVNGKNLVSHMIVTGGVDYFWVEGQSHGFKMAYNPVNQTGTSPGGLQTYNNINTGGKMNYNCSGWTPDDSVFTLPANMDFSDFSGVIPGTSAAGSPSGLAPADKCAVCANLSGTQKTQCLAVMGCK